MTNEQIEFQDHFASREIRYALMRFLRLLGWVLCPIGFATWLFGFGLFAQCLFFPSSFGEPIHIITWILGPVIFLLGVGICILCLFICVPYQFESRSEEAQGARCRHCGGELVDPGNIFPRCPACKTVFTLRFSVVAARFFSSLITVGHVLVIAVMFIFAFCGKKKK